MKKVMLLLVLTLFLANPARAGDDEERRENRQIMERHFSRLFETMRFLNSPLQKTALSGGNSGNNPLHFSEEETVNGHAGVLPLSKDSNWYLEAFMIRIRPRFGFNLPGIVSLKIVPEAEIYWSR